MTQANDFARSWLSDFVAARLDARQGEIGESRPTTRRASRGDWLRAGEDRSRIPDREDPDAAERARSRDVNPH